MTTIRAMLEKFQSLDIETEIPKILDRTSDDIIELNQGQLLHGVDSSEEEITPGYHSFVYERQKNEMNPLAGLGVPDLKLTGAFYNGFSLKTTKDTFEVVSNDPKSLDLTSKYGAFIFGLSTKNKTVYSKGKFYDELKNYITSKTGLQFR